ncbi:Amidohydrolase [Novosphingobium sp. CF614]|uniref:amidohydrolase family protein n=1 Tax=Novosphingobium sp. CF614 TaxID=1884364 RepID=UPI0008E53484|nr:amidohydrolase family protein [Novosphingobium sp. CF614]SFF90171.1 Amidohydrolase [Novosphingobium sp. CF614]
MADKITYTLISADSHVLEPADMFEKRLPAHLLERAPKLKPFEGGSAWFIGDLDPVPLPPTARTGSGYRLSNMAGVDAVAYEDVLPALIDPAERIKAQEADSVDAEVLYPTPSLWDAIKLLDDAELQLACVKAYNDWIAEFCAYAPDRLIGIGKVPTTSVEDACAEVLRCANELKLRGFVLDCFPSGAKVGGNPADDPFWEAVNETGLPVSLHIAVGPTANTMPESGPTPGMRPQMAEAVLPMVASGLFDRFPNVRVVLAHGDAGWAMHWLEFNDMYYLRHRHLNAYTLKDENALPSEYIRSRVWFTFHHDQTAVKNRHNIGPAHLMWASHFPYDDSNWPDNRQQATRVTAEAPAGARDGFLAANVARLYGLPGYEAGFEDAALKEFVPLVHY